MLFCGNLLGNIIIVLKSLNVKNGLYTGTLQFTFVDNFGLDTGDLDQGILAGFRSWFILQHYDKYAGNYKPFKTYVTIDLPIFGSLECISI